MAASNIKITYEIDDKELKDNDKLLEKVDSNLESVQKEVTSTNKKFADTNKQLASTNSTLAGLGGQLKATANNIQIMGIGLGDLTSKSVESVRGIGGMVTALKTFKIALAATGVGLLLVALGSLVAFFTKTQRGVDMANKAFAAIGATVSVFTDRLSMLGEMLINLDFSNILSVFKGITQEIKEEAAAASTLEGAMQRVRDEEIALNIERSKSRARIKELNLLAENTKKSIDERADAAREAIKIESELLASQIELQQRKVSIITEQNRLGESLTEDVEREAAEREKLNQLSESSLESLSSDGVDTYRQKSMTGTEVERKAGRKMQMEPQEQNDIIKMLPEGYSGPVPQSLWANMQPQQQTGPNSGSQHDTLCHHVWEPRG